MAEILDDVATDTVDTAVDTSVDTATDTTTDAVDTKVEAKSDAKVEDVQVDVKADVKTDTKATDKAPDWPDDWRDKAAGGDAKILARLARYASPKAVADALIAAQNRISQGDLKPSLKKDATPEQLKEYREALGIPDEPSKYDLGIFKEKIGDANKEMIEGYLARAHATNQTPDQVRAGIEAYFEITTKAAENRRIADANVQQTAQDDLRGEWGNDYRRNINLINSFLDGAPQGLKQQFLNGRLQDGTPIGSHPDALRWLLQLELERNPVGVVTPGAGANMAQSVDDEIKVIEKAMYEDRKAYDKDEKMQKRYRDLLEYRLTQGKKAA